MKLTNYDDRFGPVSKFLHWSIALLVAFQFAGGIGGIERDAHASAGLLVLLLAAFRVVWRMAVPLPDWAPGLTGFERRLVHFYEMVIYLMLFAKPITGLLLLGADDREVEFFGTVELQPVIGESKDGEDLFESLHFWSGAILGAALTLHIGLVLRHQFLLKDGMLFRMWPFGRP